MTDGCATDGCATDGCATDGCAVPAVARPSRPEPADGALAPSDLELLRLLGEGLSVEKVARQANASERTVRRRYRTICDRLGVQAPIQAVVWAARRGLL